MTSQDPRLLSPEALATLRSDAGMSRFAVLFPHIAALAELLMAVAADNPPMSGRQKGPP